MHQMEWCVLDYFMEVRILYKFYLVQPSTLIILLIVDVKLKIDLQFLVNPFCLSIGLRMIDSK